MIRMCSQDRALQFKVKDCVFKKINFPKSISPVQFGIWFENFVLKIGGYKISNWRPDVNYSNNSFIA